MTAVPTIKKPYKTIKMRRDEMLNPSSVTISEETRRRLEHKKAYIYRLQREAIIRYIKSKPTGTPISPSEMGRQIGLIGNRLGNITGFLRTMQDNGLITIEKVPHSYKKILTVSDNVVVSTPRVDVQLPTKHPQIPPKAPTKQVSPEPTPEPEETVTHPELEPDVRRWSATELEALAQRYLYYNNDDSIPHFLLWLEPHLGAPARKAAKFLSSQDETQNDDH